MPAAEQALCRFFPLKGLPFADMLHTSKRFNPNVACGSNKLTLSAKARGFHLITDEIVGQLNGLTDLRIGQLHLLLQHTSASLTLNENCDPTVRSDMEQHFLRHVPEDAPYQHDYEGADDMPAHIKSSLLGVSLLIPVSRGKLLLGTGRGSGWANIGYTARGASSPPYKGIKHEHVGFTDLLHEQTGRFTKL